MAFRQRSASSPKGNHYVFSSSAIYYVHYCPPFSKTPLWGRYICRKAGVAGQRASLRRLWSVPFGDGKKTKWDIARKSKAAQRGQRALAVFGSALPTTERNRNSEGPLASRYILRPACFALWARAERPKGEPLYMPKGLSVPKGLSEKEADYAPLSLRLSRFAGHKVGRNICPKGR